MATFVDCRKAGPSKPPPGGLAQPGGSWGYREEPSVLRGCQLVYRQVTGAAGVRYKHSLWTLLLTVKRQAPPRGSLAPQPGPGGPRGRPQDPAGVGGSFGCLFIG